MPDSGRTQRRLSVLSEAAPQRCDLGQGNARTIAGIASASTAAVARPGFSVTAKYTPSRVVSWSWVSPVLRRNPSSACGGAEVLGPFTSSLTAWVACGRSRAINARRRGVDQTVTAPNETPAAAICSRNSFSRAARAPACMRAGTSSERSSRRKSVMPNPPRHGEGDRRPQAGGGGGSQLARRLLRCRPHPRGCPKPPIGSLCSLVLRDSAV